MFPKRVEASVSVIPSVPRIMKIVEEAKNELDNYTYKELEEANKLGAIEYARAFVAIRQLKDHIEESFKEFSKKYEEIKTQTLPELFEAAGVPTVNLDEGYRVTVSHQLRASVRSGQKDSALKWLRDNNLGDIVTETVNASTLSALARSMAEDNHELDSEIFNVAILPNTSVTKI